MKQINSYNVCFIGRTGNGKSSLINALWNTHFSTNPLVACTKELYSATFLKAVSPNWEGISVYDTPGIGEFSSDSPYERYYEHTVSIADCIVLVTTFDRNDAPAQKLLRRIKPFLKNESVHFVVALNHIDSKVIIDNKATYEPWNDSENRPTETCVQNIQERVKIIHEKFDGKLLPFDVIPVCAARKYGIETLKNNILNQ